MVKVEVDMTETHAPQHFVQKHIQNIIGFT